MTECDSHRHGDDEKGSPMVSIILPTYNGERYVAEAVESVIGQSYQNWELVAVDDGSDDATPDILSSFGQVKLIRQENRGVSHARNTGVKHASGDLLAFLDQDDRWLPEKLSRQVDILRQRPDLELVFAHEEMFLVPGTEKPRWLKAEMLDQPHPSFVPGVWLLTRAAFSRVGPFDETFRCGGDTDWISRARDLGVRMETVAGVLLQKRVHGENESRRVGTSHKEIAQLLRASILRKRKQP